MWFIPIPSRFFPWLTDCRDMAQTLRYSRDMEATQSYPNLLSEKQAAKRLGVARITLLRAREAGRIRFFRIGTRVLYCAEHLTEFLNACERNRPSQMEKPRATHQEKRIVLAQREDHFASETRARRLTHERRSRLFFRSLQVARVFLCAFSFTIQRNCHSADRGGEVRWAPHFQFVRQTTENLKA